MDDWIGSGRGETAAAKPQDAKAKVGFHLPARAGFEGGDEAALSLAVVPEAHGENQEWCRNWRDGHTGLLTVWLARPLSCEQAAKKAALKGTSGTALRKVRTSVTFHRCVLVRFHRGPWTLGRGAAVARGTSS